MARLAALFCGSTEDALRPQIVFDLPKVR